MVSVIWEAPYQEEDLLLSSSDSGCYSFPLYLSGVVYCNPSSPYVEYPLMVVYRVSRQ